MNFEEYIHHWLQKRREEEGEPPLTASAIQAFLAQPEVDTLRKRYERWQEDIWMLFQELPAALLSEPEGFSIEKLQVDRILSPTHLPQIHAIDPDEGMMEQERPSSDLYEELPHYDFTVTAEKENELHVNLTHVPQKIIQIPNGKVGEPYLFILDFDSYDLSDVGEYEIGQLDMIGLTLSKDRHILSGIPLTPGNFEFPFRFNYAHQVGLGELLFKGIIHITIHPDPRTLWKSIPSVQQDLYWKPDDRNENVNGDGVTILAASRRGRTHAHEGKCREDDFEIAYLPQHKWHILAIADGAGSAKFSRKGAALATEIVVEGLVQLITQSYITLEKEIGLYHQNPSRHRDNLDKLLFDYIGSAAFTAFKHIEREAQAQAASAKDFATTLHFVIAKRFDFGWFIAGFGVGDGVMALYYKKERVKILTQPDINTSAGQTRFLTEEQTIHELRKRSFFDIYPNFTSLFLLTDGMADPFFPLPSNLQDIALWDIFRDELKNHIQYTKTSEEAGQRLLEHLNFWSNGSHDDRSIIMMYP